MQSTEGMQRIRLPDRTPHCLLYKNQQPPASRSHLAVALGEARRRMSGLPEAATLLVWEACGLLGGATTLISELQREG
jgi:hypothetical protein